MKNFKKLFAIVATAAVVFTSLGLTNITSAASFSNELQGAYDYAYGIGITTQSSIDSANMYGNLLRAHMAKMMVAYAKEVKHMTPDTSVRVNFTDISGQSAELQDYIVEAAQMGLMGLNSDGSVATKFNPTGVVTRAEFGTVLDRVLNGNANNGGTPYYAAHLAALKSAGVMTNIATPNANEVRGYVMLMMQRGSTGTTTPATCSTAENILACTLGTSACPAECKTNEVKSGSLSVQFASSNPEAMSIPSNAPSFTYAIYNVTAGGSDVSIKSMNVTRMGLGDKSDFSKIRIENADGIRVSAKQSIDSDDTATLTFSPALVVKANGTEKLSLVAKMAGNNSKINYFKLNSIDSSAQDINGTPLTSNAMTTTTYAVANLSSLNQGSATTYQVGETNQVFAQLKLTNDSPTKDMLLKTLTVHNDGTARLAEDLGNLGIYINGSKVSGTPIINGEVVTFPLNNYLLEAGKSQVVYIRGDIIGADQATENIKFNVRYNEDFNAIEKVTGFGITHALESLNGTVYTINGGDVSLIKASNAPAGQTKARGATNVNLLMATLTSKQDFYADGVKIKLYTNQGNGNATLSAADLKNLKLYINGKLIATKAGEVADFEAGAADNNIVNGGSSFILNYDNTVNLNKGTNSITLVGDIESLAVWAHIYRAEIIGSSAFTNAKYTSNDRAISTPAGTVTAGDVTIGSSNLSLTENSGIGGQTYVAWSQNLTIAKYNLKANDSDNITVTRMKFSLIWGGVNGTNIPSATLYVNGVAAGSTKSFTNTNAWSVEFNDVNFTVAQNAQTIVELKVNLDNSANGTLQVALSDMDAKDSSSTDATINGAAFAAVNGPSVTIGGQWTLVVNNNTNSISSRVISASNSVEQELGKFTLGAQNDSIKVTNLYMQTFDGSNAVNLSSRISSIALYDNTWSKVADGIVNGNYVYFDMGDNSTLIVPKDNNSYSLTVKAKFNPITNLSQTATKVSLKFSGKPADAANGTVANGVRAISTSNGNLISTITPTSTPTNLMFVTKTKLTFAAADHASLMSPTSKLATNSAMKAYAFSVTADAAGDAELNSIVLNINKTSWVTVNNVKVYDADDSSTVLFNGAYTSLDKLAFTASQRITAGTTKTYIVELDVTVAWAAQSLSTQLVQWSDDSSFTTAVTGNKKATLWSDLADSAHSSTPADAKDWFLGYKVGLDNITSRSYSNN